MKKMIPIITVFISFLFTCSAKSQPVIADFQVNENSGGVWSQQEPKILVLGNNNYLVIWSDSREEDGVFAQLFSSDGIALADNFLLEGARSKFVITESFATAVNDSGSFIVVWRYGSTFTKIMAQLFNSDGVPIGENFRVGDYVGNVTERFPAVASGDSGSFIITWDASSPQSLFGDIFARRFDGNGTPMAASFKVNGDAGSMTGQQRPDIATNASGEYIITWQDKRIDFNFGDIYAQRFDKDDNMLGSNFKVNDEGNNTTILQIDPVITANDSGYFVIAWRDSREGALYSYQDIYAQRYNRDGDLLGVNFKVTDYIDSLQQRKPSVAMNSNGDFLITWTDRRDEYDDTYVQLYSSDGTEQGDNQKINEYEDDKWDPYVTADNNGDFILTWSDSRGVGSHNDIYMQKIAGNGSLIGSSFHTSNEQLVSTFDLNPCVILDNTGAFTIVWKDQRGKAAIYAQRYESNGAPIDTNYRISDGQGEAGPYAHDVAINNDGNLLISWGDIRNGFYRSVIYAQLYSADGTATGSNFKVDDDTSNATQTQSNVAAVGSDNFIIVWSDTRNENNDIYARRFDGTGMALDSSFKINDDEGSGSYPAVAANDSGKFLIAWSDNSSAIYAQFYTLQGTALGANFKVNDNTGGEHIFNPVITAIDSGNFVIAWKTDYININAQRVAGDGTLIGSNFQVTAGGYVQYGHAIAADENGNFIVTWGDKRNTVWPDVQIEIFAQRFNSDGTPVGADFKVTGRSIAPYEHSPAVNLFNNRIYTTWSDRDRLDLGTGTDIWVNVLDWNNPVGIENDKIPVAPAVFTLNQNYPNPFNPVTTINYQLPITNYVELNIYNLLGQKITTLVSKYQQAGTYQVEWDASGFASGVYIYRLQAEGKMLNKKLLLLK